VQFCLKARAAGHQVVFVPEAQAWHKVGVSARKMHLTYTNLPAYFHLIRECLPRYVFAYQVALLPILCSRWALLYLLRSRDPKALRSFAAQVFRTRSKNTG
jgi:GT2 family glycosyltransferase